MLFAMMLRLNILGTITVMPGHSEQLKNCAAKLELFHFLYKRAWVSKYLTTVHGKLLSL